MNSKQTVSREEYRRLDNRVTFILQQRWPANEISQWVGMLQGKQQAIACAILLRRHPHPTSLALPAIPTEVPNPFQAKDSRPTVIVLSADGQYAGKRHTVEGRTLWIADGSITDRANQGAAERLNPTYRPAMHQIVTDNRQIKAGNK